MTEARQVAAIRFGKPRHRAALAAEPVDAHLPKRKPTQHCQAHTTPIATAILLDPCPLAVNGDLL